MKSNDFKDKVTIITGGGSGIGEAMCKHFADKKAKVIILDNNEAEGRRVSQENKSDFIKCDISNEGSVDDAFNQIENNYGRIVNVASVAGKDGNANASAYSVGKAGAIGLTKSLGKELADKNIAVNAVTPAGAKTRILDQMTKEHVQRMLSKVPRGRFLEVEEFTSLVCWLSSEENTFSTAAVFDISGGRSTY